MLEVVHGGGEDLHPRMHPAQGRRLEVEQAGGGGADDDDLVLELVRGARPGLVGEVGEHVAEAHGAVGEGLPAPVEEHALRRRLGPAQLPRHPRRQRGQLPAVVVAVDEVAARGAVVVGIDVVQPQAPAVERGLEVREHHGDRGAGPGLAGQGHHPGDHVRLDLAQGVAGGIEAQHGEEGVAGGGDGLVEIGVAVRVVDIGVGEQDVEHHRPGPLRLELLQELPQHLPGPRPAPELLAHRRQAGLVDVHDDDVGIGLGHDDPPADHGVEGRLAHVGGAVQEGRVGHGEQGEEGGEIQVEAGLPAPGQQPVEGGHRPAVGTDQQESRFHRVFHPWSRIDHGRRSASP